MLKFPYLVAHRLHTDLVAVGLQSGTQIRDG